MLSVRVRELAIEIADSANEQRVTQERVALEFHVRLAHLNNVADMELVNESLTTIRCTIDIDHGIEARHSTVYVTLGLWVSLVTCECVPRGMIR